MSQEPTVFVVDDDQAVRSVLHFVLTSAGYGVELHANAQEFLEACDPERPGCLVLDVRMPGMSGLSLQQELVQQNVMLPVIILTGHGDVPMAVRALKQGAFDFLEKPFENEALLNSVQRAVEFNLQQHRRKDCHRKLGERLELLTPPEREVLEGIMAGRLNKMIASDLGVTISTVEKRRKHIMEKLQADNLSELLQMIWFYRRHP